MPTIRLKNVILNVDIENDHIEVKPTKVMSDKFNFTRQDFALLGTKLERPLKKLWANMEDDEEGGTAIKKKTFTRKRKTAQATANA